MPESDKSDDEGTYESHSDIQMGGDEVNDKEGEMTFSLVLGMQALSLSFKMIGSSYYFLYVGRGDLHI